ncbi:MAG: hypothetical protein MOB07_05175 [Acidobacteria bacterium]|nr:hypothetical protein [Acidobacteriota bacterium]
MSAILLRTVWTVNALTAICCILRKTLRSLQALAPLPVQGEVLRRVALKAAVNTRASADPVPFYITIEHDERKPQ